MVENSIKEALIFKELDKVWKELSIVYNSAFKHLVYGDLPKDEEILETLQRLKQRLL